MNLSRKINGKNRIPLPSIIAYNSTDKAQQLLSKFGYQKASNVRELELRLAQIIKNSPDGLKAIAQIHPDKDLILEYNTAKMMEGGKSNGHFYNSTGLPPDIIYVPSYAGTESTLMEVEDWGDVRIRKMKGGYEQASGDVAKKGIGAGTIILSVLALGAIMIASGEARKRI